jgi:mannan endo-1,4-beta-mannosidase
MRSGQKTFGSLFILLCIVTSSLFGSDDTIQPVTPNASPEAKALLEFMVRISGKYTLTGQHNFPNTKDRNSQFAAKYIGKTPAVWSTDWGFAEEGDTDSYLARPDIVEEARRQHELGSVITICWHAVPPTADEPVTFRPRPNAPPGALASVQGQLLDQQFKDVLTPGTELNKKWCAQVDAVAFHLKKLQEARVPILWRPYHEMNGDWFWWGGRLGQYSTKALYRQIFDRLVHHHKLTNLVWVWSVDRPNKPEMQFSNYYPGDDYLDILSLDVYRSDFNQSYYDDLLALSNGKPLVLGEVGNPPTLEILGHQPKWGLYVIWAGMVRNTLKKQHRVLVHDPRILSLEDPAYWKAIAPFRAACKLPPLPLKGKKIDLSGTWIFNEDDSVLDNWGLGGAPYKLELAQKENELAIRRSFIVEWGDDRITEEKLSLDGTEHKSTFWNSPRITTARWSEDGDMLIVESKVTFTRGDRTNEMVTKEVWSLLKQGDVLSMAQTSTSFRGERKITMMFDKR